VRRSRAGLMRATPGPPVVGRKAGAAFFCGCGATIRFRECMDRYSPSFGKWYICGFSLHHNHSPNLSGLVQSRTQLAPVVLAWIRTQVSEVRLATKVVRRLLKRSFSINISRKCLQNIVSETRRTAWGTGTDSEAQKVVSKLSSMAHTVVRLNDEDALSSLLCVPDFARRALLMGMYHDQGGQDTTHKTNPWGLKLGYCVTLGPYRKNLNLHRQGGRS
jgi:hypothetical protein